MLISRYLAKEIVLALLATLIVLLGILFSQRLAVYLTDAASGNLSQSAVLQLLSLQMLRLGAELLPLSFLIASLMAFGRLYKDSEISAMFALGVSTKLFYRALLRIAVPLSILLFVLNFYVVPETSALQRDLQIKARNDAQLNIFKAGVFKEILSGLHVIYVGEIADDGTELRNIFLRSTLGLGKFAITTAARGKQYIDPATNIRFLDLFDGQRYEVDANFEDLSKKKENVLLFETARLKMDTLKSNDNIRDNTMPTLVLWEQNTASASAELQRRLSGSLSIFVLLLMVPALAHAKPREGKYNRLILGIFVYVLYFNLLGIAEAWIKKDYVSPVIGIWWVHLLMLGLGLFVRYKQNGRL